MIKTGSTVPISITIITIITTAAVLLQEVE